MCACVCARTHTICNTAGKRWLGGWGTCCISMRTGGWIPNIHITGTAITYGPESHKWEMKKGNSHACWMTSLAKLVSSWFGKSSASANKAKINDRSQKIPHVPDLHKYTCTYRQVHKYTHIHIHIGRHIHTYMHAHTFICAHTYMHAHMHTHSYTHA